MKQLVNYKSFTTYKKHIYCFIICIFLSLSHSSAQSPKTLNIKRSTEKIVIDGILNEQSWQVADLAQDFQQNFPSDSLKAKSRTEVRMCYDDKSIYVAAKCYDPIKGPFIVQSLVRDFSFPRTDAFAISLCPNNDNRNGFSFAVNPYGVQREGVLTHGGAYGVTTAWDNKWFCQTQIKDGYWTVEMAIPFRSIRYNSEASTWQLNFVRHDQKQNEMSTWGRVPVNFNISAIPFSGTLKWDSPPPKAGTNYAIIPYTFGNYSANFENQTNDKFGNFGMDAKISLSSSMNMDLTANPDFSQVEVDQQLINLTRYSLFYPEKRNFFIENSDLFSRFGFRQIRPFFSRRIGLYNGQQVPIIGGARLSGNLDKNWRLGLMNITTNEKPDFNLKSQNYSVAAVQRRLFAGSNLGLIMVNRQAMNKTEIISNDYNRVIGMDFNLSSIDHKYIGQVFYHKAFTSEKLNDNKAHASYFNYQTPSLRLMWNHEYAGKNYIAETGFVPRLYNYDQSRDTTIRMSFWRLEPSMAYYFYPKGKKIFKHGASLYLDYFSDSSFALTDRLIRLSYDMEFLNKSSIELNTYDQTTRLVFPIDISGKGEEPLPADIYNYKSAEVEYRSNARRLLFVGTSIKAGQFYNGHILSYSLGVTYRKQPWGIFSMNLRYNDLRLPKPYNSSKLILFGPKVQLSFTKSLFLSTYIQYNTQIENININSRLQWRFRPMSDLYLVYTDNYDTYFYKKNRAFVLKFVYWLSP